MLEKIKSVAKAAGKRRGLLAAAIAVPTVLVLAGGTAVASHLVNSADIENQSIQSIDIARSAVAASELRNGSIKPWDLDPELRKQVEEGSPQGEKGDKGDKGDPGVSELESDGPYPGATQLSDNPGNGANSEDKWTGDKGAALQSSWVMCPEGKTAIGGGFSRADEGTEAFKGLQVVTSQPVQIVDGDPTAYDPIEGDKAGSYVPNGWLVEGFNNNKDGELIVRPHVVCAKVS